MSDIHETETTIKITGEVLRKGRDTECRGGATRKEVWEAEIRRWKESDVRNGRREKTDGIMMEREEPRVGTNRGKRGRNKGIRKEEKIQRQLPKLEYYLIKHKADTKSSHWCRQMCQIKMKDSGSGFYFYQRILNWRK